MYVGVEMMSWMELKIIKESMMMSDMARHKNM